MVWSFCTISKITTMILSNWIDRSGQTMHTQITLLLEEQSHQGLHCLLFCLHLLNRLPYGKNPLLPFMILSNWIDRSGQTVHTQITLLLEEQSHQGLHCLLFCLHLLNRLPYGKNPLLPFLEGKLQQLFCYFWIFILLQYLRFVHRINGRVSLKQTFGTFHPSLSCGTIQWGPQTVISEILEDFCTISHSIMLKWVGGRGRGGGVEGAGGGIQTP